jgi:hypothetical protein
MKATKAELLERINELENSITNCNSMTRWYNNLRKKEIVVLDGEARYLTGDDLDEYCKSITPSVVTHQELLKELTPALNNLFGQEYAKYETEYKEAFNDTGSQS